MKYTLLDYVIRRVFIEKHFGYTAILKRLIYEGYFAIMRSRNVI